MFLNSLSGKLIAVLLAILMPFASLSPAIPNGNQNGKPVTHKVKEGNVYVEVVKEEPAVEYEEEVAPVAEPEVDEDAAAPEINENTPAEEPEVNEDAEAPEGTGDVELLAGIIDRAAAIETEADEDAEPIASWDVSNTEDDDVHMYYYAANIASFARTLTASIKELVLPITAYAAVEDPDEVENGVIADGDYVDVVDNEVQYREGTVVIEGEGATEAMLFTRWLNYDKFVPYYENWCDRHNVYNTSYYVLKTDLDANGNIVGETLSADDIYEIYKDVPDEILCETILDSYFPVYMRNIIDETDNFWEEFGTFIPKHIEIRGNVDRINFAAFAFCSSVTQIDINANIKTIDSAAFVGTGVRTLVVPASVEKISEGAFSGCKHLNEIYVYATIRDLSTYAFINLPDNAKIYCEVYSTFCKIAEITPDPTFVPESGKVLTEKYTSTTDVVYNPALFD